MYTFIREATFKTIADAMKGMPAAIAICKYYKEAHGVDVRLMRPVMGSPNRVRFVAEAETLDEHRALNKKVMQDPAFHKLLGEISQTVDGSKTVDEYWE